MAKFFAIAWAVFCLIVLFPLYWIISSAGLRELNAIFAYKFSKLPIPLFHHFSRFEGWRRLDVGYLVAVAVMVAVFWLWHHILKDLLLVEGSGVDGKVWKEESLQGFSKVVGYAVLGADAILFFCGLVASGSGPIGALVLTVIYVGLLLFFAYVNIFLWLRAERDKT